MSINNPPDFVAARDHVQREIIQFSRRLRSNGVTVPVSASIAATEALVEVGLSDRRQIKSALIATMISDSRDLPVFEEYFPRFWYALRTGLEAVATSDGVSHQSTGTRERPDELTFSTPMQDETARATEPEQEADPLPPVEIRHSDAELTDSEGNLDEEGPEYRGESAASVGTGRVIDEDAGISRTVTQDAVRRLERVLATQRGRRWIKSSPGIRIDTRRSLRRTLETGGVPLSLYEEDKTMQTLRVCVLVDVSQSVLDAIDRAFLLSFLNELSVRGRPTRIFFFDTAIRDVTEVFLTARGDPVSALADAEIAWGGGTQIGAALSNIRTSWPAAVDHRTATIVISDGLEVGGIDVLEREMAWLARRSGSIVWFNPLATSTAYEPTCSGMEVATPFVDGLFAFGGPDDIVEAARQLNRHGPCGPIGYQQDFRDRSPGVRPT